MNCEQIIKLLDAYADDELDVGTIVLIEDHLAGCEQCGVDLKRIHAVRAMDFAAIATPCPSKTADEVFRAVRSQSADDGSATLTIAGRESNRFARGPRWMNWAVAAALLISVVSLWQSDAFNRQKDRLAINDLVAAHLRSMQADHLLDVVSTDQHTVRPWFNGKLDFSPRVKDFAAEGFPLEGGRLDYFDNHPVAALVYRRNKHVINVFVWRAADQRVDSPTSFEGFNLCSWTADGLRYEAVSDLNEVELSQLGKLLESP